MQGRFGTAWRVRVRVQVRVIVDPKLVRGGPVHLDLDPRHPPPRPQLTCGAPPCSISCTHDSSDSTASAAPAACSSAPGASASTTGPPRELTCAGQAAARSQPGAPPHTLGRRAHIWTTMCKGTAAHQMQAAGPWARRGAWPACLICSWPQARGSPLSSRACTAGAPPARACCPPPSAWVQQLQAR